jgi:hypothetical protein
VSAHEARHVSVAIVATVVVMVPLVVVGTVMPLVIVVAPRIPVVAAVPRILIPVVIVAAFPVVNRIGSRWLRWYECSGGASYASGTGRSGGPRETQGDHEPKSQCCYNTLHASLLLELLPYWDLG